MLDSSDGKWECATAVRKRNTQLWKPFEDSAEDHRTNRKGSLSRHPDKPGQPIFRHPLLADHVPGMDKDGGVELLRCAPDRLKRGVVEIQVSMRPKCRFASTWVPICAPRRAEVTNRTLQFLRRQIGVLQRDGRQTGKAFRMIANDIGNVIIQPPRKIERVMRPCPITEHHRDGRKHLHRDFFAIHLFDAAFRVPNIIGDFAKDAVADHHSRATRFVMIETDETRVAIFGVEIGPMARKDVSVQIDLQESD